MFSQIPILVKLHIIVTALKCRSNRPIDNLVIDSVGGDNITEIDRQTTQKIKIMANKALLAATNFSKNLKPKKS